VENGDGTGVVLVSDTATGITVGAWQEISIDVNQVAGTANIYKDGTSIQSRSWTPVTSNDFFQTGRRFAFLAQNGTGTFLLPSGWEIEFMEMYKTVLGTRTLHKRIEGNAATVNADAWKQGANAT
jgi:hypothetical protein